MKKYLLLIFLLSAHFFVFAQKDKLPKMSAGFPINYEEDSVGAYILPDLFTLSNGQKVNNSKTWTEKRRPELLKFFEEIEYGKMPGPPAGLHFDVFDAGTLMFDGKATRKQVSVYFTKDTSAYKMTLLIYLPVDTKPVPLLMNISFVANNQLVDDAAVKVGYIWTKEGQKIKADQPARFPKMNIEQFIKQGIGFATVYYGDIEPDFKGGIKYGIRSRFLKSGQTEPAANEWGAISAWAWETFPAFFSVIFNEEMAFFCFDASAGAILYTNQFLMSDVAERSTVAPAIKVLFCWAKFCRQSRRAKAGKITFFIT